MNKFVIAILMFFVFTSAYSQKLDSSLRQIKDKSFSFDILLGFSTPPVAMDYLQFDAGYYIARNSELGISFGREDSPSGNGEDFVMYGIYFSQHFGDEFQAGLRMEFPGEYSPANINTYSELYVGKDFLITSQFSIRLNIFWSYMSDVILGLNGNLKYSKVGFQAGVNYLF
jgi:hypothetical protein